MGHLVAQQECKENFRQGWGGGLLEVTFLKSLTIQRELEVRKLLKRHLGEDTHFNS